MRPYVIVEGKDAIELAEKCNDLVPDGYVPVGSFVICTKVIVSETKYVLGRTMEVYSQVMFNAEV